MSKMEVNMELISLTKEEYQIYTAKNCNPDFLQSVYAANKMLHDGWIVEYYKAVENEKVISVFMIGYVHLLHYFYYAYIPRGFFIDYEDQKALVKVTEELKKILKKKRVIYLEIDPKISLRQHDKNGDVVVDGINNEHIVENLKHAGFDHQPLKHGYDTTKQCRWISVIDLRGKTKDDVFADFSIKTRNDIRTAQKYGVKVRALKEDELSILNYMEQEAGQRHDFEAVTMDTFKTMYSCYKDHVKTLYAYLDLDEYEQSLKSEIEPLEKEIQELKEFLQENPNSKKKQNRLKVAQEYYESLQKKSQEVVHLKEKYDKEVPLAGSMFVKFGDEVVYLSSGMDYQFRTFRGAYAIQWEMIQEAVDEGYSYYNMLGISGFFKKGEDGYGVFDFKRGFNACVVEYIGNFILPVRQFLYKISMHKQNKDRAS